MSGPEDRIQGSDTSRPPARLRMDEQLELLSAAPATAGPELIERAGLRVRYWRRWLKEASEFERDLLKDVPWKQDQITLWGRTHPLPRLTCWVGDRGCSYTYSGVANPIEPWTDLLADLREQVQDTVGCRFNSLLLNLYRDGRDKLHWHADDEKELDPQAPIASLSLGSARTFRLRPKDPEGGASEALSFELGGGDLLVMDPPTQEHWLHGVPARLRVTQPRLNLTFRVIRSGLIRHV